MQGAPEMYRIRCTEIWGGIRDQEQDVCSAGIVASLYSSASDGGKGGDIYFLSVCGSDLLTRVAVADVVGHGEAVSEMSQFIYEALKSHMNDPGENKVLQEVNRLAVGRGLTAMTTAAVISFYRTDNSLNFSYAGHHPLLVKRHQQSAWHEAVVQKTESREDAKLQDVPLAISSGAVYTQERMPLAARDRLLLYTDGVIDALNRRDEYYGVERLRSLLRDHGDATLQRLRTAVLDDVLEHTEGNLTHDDMTFLAIEIR